MRSALLAAWLAHCGHGRHGQDAVQVEGGGAEQATPERQLNQRGCEGCSHVYLMRHCVRGTGEPEPEYQAYSSLPVPDWDSPDEWCTGGGFAITSNVVGQFLRDRYGLRPGRVSATNDGVMRKVQTAQAVMAGIYSGRPQAWRMETDEVIFANASARGCPVPDEAVQMDEARRLLETTPMPGGLGPPPEVDPARWGAMLESFKRVIGVGNKTIMELMPPSYTRDVSWSAEEGQPRVRGSASALKYFAQQLFYAKASGVDPDGRSITFGGQELNVSIEELFPLYSWEAYFHQVETGPSLKAANGVGIARALLHQLSKGTPPGYAHIFSMSDTNFDPLRVLFNLTWTPLHYAGSVGPTPPNVGLMFTKRPTGEVNIDAVTVNFDGTLSPSVSSVPASPASTSLADLEHRMAVALRDYPAARACAQRQDALLV